MGGWLENWRVLLILTQIVVKVLVEVEVDIGNIISWRRLDKLDKVHLYVAAGN